LRDVFYPILKFKDKNRLSRKLKVSGLLSFAGGGGHGILPTVVATEFWPISMAGNLSKAGNFGPYQRRPEAPARPRTRPAAAPAVILPAVVATQLWPAEVALPATAAAIGQDQPRRQHTPTQAGGIASTPTSRSRPSSRRGKIIFYKGKKKASNRIDRKR